MYVRHIFFISLLFFISGAGFAQPANRPLNKPQPPLRFSKKQIASESFESVEVFDVNQDRIADIVSGAFWYEGPLYFKRHVIGPVNQVGEYWDDFSTVPMDVNGDGRMDFVTGGWFGKKIIWKENPGRDTIWRVHDIAVTGNVETTRAWDVDGDGTPEIVPNTPNDPLVIYRLVRDNQGKGTGTFEQFNIAGNIAKQGHGLGFGDVNGDGRGDFILGNGWAEAPANPYKNTWIFHPELNLGTSSIPIIVADVNKDGINDLIAGQAHDYGLNWYEQKSDPKTKNRVWIKHPIDPFNSQFHAMLWTDLDGDGQEELVTGKRYRAHNGNDPGEADNLGTYYYKWNGESFTKQLISYGPYGEGKGTGIYFSVSDLTGSGRKDIITAGKDGLWVFYNVKP